jgi:hypothetical protein
VSTLTAGAIVQGLTVGLGAGAVATNTAVGASALAANTTGGRNTALGNESLFSNTTGNNNLAVGGRDNGAWTPLYSNTTGSSNTAVGNGSLAKNTTASNNTAVGYQAGYTNTVGTSNVFIGQTAGYSQTGSGNVIIGQGAGYLSTGSRNTFVGATKVGTNGCGDAMTTGSANTILGNYSGNQGGLNIRTASNYIVLSDGDGNPRVVLGAEGRRVFRQSDSSDGAGFEGWINWLNVSSTTFNLQTLFPESSILNRGLNITLQIVTQSNSSNSSTYFVMAGRNPDGSNWQFNTIAAQTRGGDTVTVTGANDSITLTFSVGAQYGRCMIRGITQT